ncbi:MAG: S41 family peptidase [bacterium]|nr:S41 family peptidase [bacterium]
MNSIDILKLKSTIYALLICAFSYAQDMSGAEVKEDLIFLQSKILQYQPGIRKSAPEFEKLSNIIIAQNGEDSLTYLEFFREVCRMSVMAREGHYSLGNWSDTVHNGFPNNTIAYIPMDVKVINHRLYIEEDYSKEQELTAGSEILRINGKPAAAILQELYYCIPSDGSIITNVMDELDQTFAYKYYLFIDQSEYFGITFKEISGAEKSVSVKALTRKEQRQNIRESVLPNRPQKENINAVYSLDIASNYARLTLRSFNSNKLSKRDIKPRRFFKDIFDTIRRSETENLIIDLRGNPGGLFEMAQEIMPYVMSENPKDPFQRKSTSWSGKERKYKFRKRSRKAFEGQIYVLINGGTFSSGSTLARYLKEHSNAVIIGEESGSRYESFAAGSKQYVQLPNSGIEIGIPRYLIEFGEGEKQTTQNRGVLPDYTVQPTMLHILAGRDLHLEKALELISEK